MQNIAIIGAGGHTRSLLNLIKTDIYNIDGIYDDSFNSNSPEYILGQLVKGKISDIPANSTIILAIGDNYKREHLFYENKKAMFTHNLIHTKAFLEGCSVAGISNQIFADVYVNSGAIIGDNNIINTRAVIEHEVILGSHCHISVGSLLCGRVVVGNRCFIGAGAVVIDKIRICDDVIVGANTVVIYDITVPGTYVGNPARKIN